MAAGGDARAGGDPPRSVLVVTVVHHPEDARIRHRQIVALARAGWRITYAAPFTACGRLVPESTATFRALDLPRAAGRDRTPALLAARRLLRLRGRDHDLVLLHDPELLLAAAGLGLRNVVWDVHEDTAAAIEAKCWLPKATRGLARHGIRAVERSVERTRPLLLAEYGYRDRFRRDHPVVPNTTWVPPSVRTPAGGRAVYLGTVSMARGARALVDTGRILQQRTDGACRLEVIGPAADAATGELLRRAHEEQAIVWHGFVDNTCALPMLEGAVAGLSLLQDRPNYRHSMPTKVLEYMARGVPVVSTPLPVARRTIEPAGSGIIVAFDDPHAAAGTVLRLRDDLALAARMGARGHRTAVLQHDWTATAEGFVKHLNRLAREHEKRGRAPRRPAVRSLTGGQ